MGGITSDTVRVVEEGIRSTDAVAKGGDFNTPNISILYIGY